VAPLLIKLDWQLAPPTGQCRDKSGGSKTQR
jgi:hypothetical protein